VEREETSIGRIQQLKRPAIAKQRLCKHFSAAAEADATISKLLEAVFPVGYAQRLYNEDPNSGLISQTRICVGEKKVLGS
jgi:hypothetical protein